MNDPTVPPLPSSVVELLHVEAQRRPRSQADADAVMGRIRQTLALGAVGGGGGGGSPPAAEGGSAAGVSASVAKSLSVAAVSFLLGAGVVAALRPAPPPALMSPMPRLVVTVSLVASPPGPGGDTPGAPSSSVTVPPPAQESTLSPGQTASRDARPVVSLELGSPSPGSLSKERRLIEAARAELAAGDSAASLRQLADHERQFPNGALAEERDALRVRALVAAGRQDDARVSADAFHSRFPNSVHTPAVDATVARGTRPPEIDGGR